MDDEYIQLSDGSCRLKRHTNQCVLCQGIYLIDEARDRGDGRVICDNCARKYNINFCQICRRPIDFEYKGIEAKRCIPCRNKASNDSTKVEKKVLYDVLNSVETHLIDVALNLIKAGDKQKAGLLPMSLPGKNKKRRTKKWNY